MTNNGMFDKIKSIFNLQKGGMTLGLTQILVSVLTGVFTIFIAPILGAENLGTISYFSAISVIAFVISALGISNLLLVYVSKGVKIFSTISFITLIFSLISSITLFIIFKEISIGVFIIGQVIFELASKELLAKQLYSKYMKYLLTQRISFIGLSMLLYFILGPSGFIIGNGLSMFIGLVRIYLGFKESKIDFNLIKNRFNFISYNYSLTLSRNVYGYVDRLLVFPIFGYITLGNYELSMQIIIMANVFSVFLYNYLMPKDARNEVTHKLKFYSIIVSAVISLMVIFLAPRILPILFPQFQKAVELVPIMGISIIPHAIIVLCSSKFLGSEKPRLVFISSILHLGVLIIAILVLTKFYSTTGLVIAFSLAEIMDATFLIVAHKKVFKTYL